MTTEHTATATAAGGKTVRATLAILGRDLTLTFTAKGYKSSDGDGRTAADIRRELQQQKGT